MTSLWFKQGEYPADSSEELWSTVALEISEAVIMRADLGDAPRTFDCTRYHTAAVAGAQEKGAYTQAADNSPTDMSPSHTSPPDMSPTDKSPSDTSQPDMLPPEKLPSYASLDISPPKKSPSDMPTPESGGAGGGFV